MKKGLVMVLVGVILVIAAIGMYTAFSMNAAKELKSIHLGANETVEKSYQLKSGDYYLVLVTEGKIHYSFVAENNTVVKEGNVDQQSSVELGHLEGNYTLRIKNLEDHEIKVTMLLKSSESLISMGTGVLASGGVCLVGIIVLIVGIIFALKGRKEESENRGVS